MICPLLWYIWFYNQWLNKHQHLVIAFSTSFTFCFSKFMVIFLTIILYIFFFGMCFRKYLGWILWYNHLTQELYGYNKRTIFIFFGFGSLPKTPRRIYQFWHITSYILSWGFISFRKRLFVTFGYLQLQRKQYSFVWPLSI